MDFPTWVEVDLDRFGRNLAAIRAAIGPGPRILLVVKADAYGHGAVETSRAALRHGVAVLGVATLHEGIELRSAGIDAPIIILSPSLLGEVDEIIEHRLTPCVSSLEFADHYAKRCGAHGADGPLHVEVDTGMGRTGVSETDAEEFIERVVALPRLRLEGVFTHFPDADTGNTYFAEEQLRRYTEILEGLARRRIQVPIRHVANSAGILGVRGSALDMVRTGILAYGFYPSERVPRTVAVEGMMCFKTRVVQMRSVPAGRYISYARTYRTSRQTRVAVLPVGYGHGYPWLLGNRGEVLIHGRRAPIIGRVTMDLTMVDATEIPGIGPGDEVVLFGEQGAGRIDLTEVAERAETIPYEILCSMGRRVVRVFRETGQPDKVITLVGERQELETGGAEPGRRPRRVTYRNSRM